MKIRITPRFIGTFIGILIIIFVTRNTGYLLQEFILSNNVNIDTCDTCSMKYWNNVHNTKRISNIIHQIYFTVKTKSLPAELAKARQSWINEHKIYTHYLWNETAVISFIHENYPQLESLYKSYDYWVRRVNVARYLILYHYGGWYVDIDMTCVRSVDELADEAMKQNKSVVQHYTSPFGTSNDFFGVTPKHQFLRSVLDHLPNSNRWFLFPYFNTIFTTGTTYMWGRYLNYPYKDEFMILEQDEIKKYVWHHHHSTWHGWDALFVRLVAKHYFIVALFLIKCLAFIWILKSKLKTAREKAVAVMMKDTFKQK